MLAFLSSSRSLSIPVDRFCRRFNCFSYIFPSGDKYEAFIFPTPMLCHKPLWRPTRGLPWDNELYCMASFAMELSPFLHGWSIHCYFLFLISTSTVSQNLRLLLGRGQQFSLPELSAFFCWPTDVTMVPFGSPFCYA